MGTFIRAADVSGKGLADPTVISLLANTVLPRKHLKAWFFHKAYQFLDDEKQIAFQQANRHGCAHSGENAEAGTGNYRNRVLRKLAERLGFPKLTFQVIRRTIATLAKDKGHVKDIQGMMRHSRVATTTDVYMQSLQEGVRSTVNSIHDELMGTGTLGKDGSGTKPHRESRESAMTKKITQIATERRAASERREENLPRVRGKVLEFATKMLQSRDGRVPLND